MEHKKQSDLQQLNSLTNWVIYFLLREFPMHFASKLRLSNRSLQRISIYNANVRMLKASIKQDYKINRITIIGERKRKKEEALRDK